MTTLGKEKFTEITQLVEQHGKYRSECLNMIASENSASPAARAMMSTDLVNRYTVSGRLDPMMRFFPGLESYKHLEAVAIDMVKETLGAKYVTLHPISGMMANLFAYQATINPGDRVLTLKESNGGHYSHRESDRKEGKAETMLDLFGANVSYMPFDDVRYDLDYEGVARMVEDLKPKLVVVGASEMLFPINLPLLRKICDKYGDGTQIMYDAAHVAGLIFGGRFQNPLRDGADIFATSTNKSLGGVDHGLVAWNDPKYNNEIEKSLVPLFTSNHHANEVASVAVTLAENVDFGAAYADQVIRNSKTLGRTLYRLGIDVLAPERDFSESHMVLVRVGDGAKVMRDLEKANVIVSTCHMPEDDLKGPDTGLRVGTGELTRKGMCENEMMIVAHIISGVIKQPDIAGGMKSESVRLAQSFQDQKFCYRPEI